MALLGSRKESRGFLGVLLPGNRNTMVPVLAFCKILQNSDIGAKSKKTAIWYLKKSTSIAVCWSIVSSFEDRALITLENTIVPKL